jgi:hypothetical protein
VLAQVPSVHMALDSSLHCETDSTAPGSLCYQECRFQNQNVGHMEQRLLGRGMLVAKDMQLVHQGDSNCENKAAGKLHMELAVPTDMDTDNQHAPQARRSDSLRFLLAGIEDVGNRVRVAKSFGHKGWCSGPDAEVDMVVGLADSMWKQHRRQHVLLLSPKPAVVELKSLQKSDFLQEHSLVAHPSRLNEVLAD